jgi:RNA polymerase sigma-70 factor (ECF subfamily)
VDDLLAARPSMSNAVPDVAAPERDADVRLDLSAALATLELRDRELVALRYGADLTARQIGALLDLRTNAVEVALHRALDRLRRELSPSAPIETPLNPVRVETRPRV